MAGKTRRRNILSVVIPGGVDLDVNLDVEKEKVEDLPVDWRKWEELCVAWGRNVHEKIESWDHRHPEKALHQHREWVHMYK